MGDDTRTNAAELLARLRSSDVEEAHSTPEPSDGAEDAPAAKSTSQPEAREESTLQEYELSIDGGEPRWVKLDGEMTLAEAAAKLSRELVPEPVDLCGRLTAGHRLEQGGSDLYSTAKVSELDPEDLIHLTPVPNEVVRVSFDIRSDVPIRFQAPVGVAVPVRSLVAHLVDWLQLPEASWRIEVDGQRVDPLQMLEEVDVGDGSVIVVKS